MQVRHGKRVAAGDIVNQQHGAALAVVAGVWAVPTHRPVDTQGRRHRVEVGGVAVVGRKSAVLGLHVTGHRQRTKMFQVAGPEDPLERIAIDA